MACQATLRATALARRPGHRPSLVRRTLAANDARAVERGPMVELSLDAGSRIVRDNDGTLRCVRYTGLAGVFRKDRGPSKELGRALCDEVKQRFGCDGFLTSDELPRYGIGRAARRRILTAVGARDADCVVVYAYPEALARRIDDHLHARLAAMA